MRAVVAGLLALLLTACHTPPAPATATAPAPTPAPPASQAQLSTSPVAAAVRYEIDAIQQAGVAVQSVLWNVGSARLLSAFIDMGVLQTPVYAHVALANSFLAAHPPTVRGLAALVEFLPTGVDLHWTYSAVGANALALVHAAVSTGGHISIGLGDYPYNELGTPTNAELVAEAVRMLRAVGRVPATPDEVRQAFAMPSPSSSTC